MVLQQASVCDLGALVVFAGRLQHCLAWFDYGSTIWDMLPEAPLLNQTPDVALPGASVLSPSLQALQIQSCAA